MKRELLLVFAALLLCMSLCGCGGKKTQGAEEATQPAPAKVEPQEPAPAARGDGPTIVAAEPDEEIGPLHLDSDSPATAKGGSFKSVKARLVEGGPLMVVSALMCKVTNTTDCKDGTNFYGGDCECLMLRMSHGDTKLWLWVTDYETVERLELEAVDMGEGMRGILITADLGGDMTDIYVRRVWLIADAGEGPGVVWKAEIGEGTVGEEGEEKPPGIEVGFSDHDGDGETDLLMTRCPEPVGGEPAACEEYVLLGKNGAFPDFGYMDSW